MAYNNIRFFLFTAFLLIVSVQLSQAQRSFGVLWDKPENAQTAVEELREFNEMGVSAIEVRGALEETVWKEVNNLQFETYGNLGIRFPLISTFAEPDSSLLVSIENNASAYLAQPSLQAIGIFEYGPTQQSEFMRALSPYAQQIRSAGATTYFVSSREFSDSSPPVDFIIYDIRITSSRLDKLDIPQYSTIGAYRFSPQNEIKEYLYPFKQLLDATSASPGKTIFLHSEWLFKITDKYPDFKTTLRSLSKSSAAVFPVPNENIPEESPSIIPILTLLIAWGSVAFLYNSSPIYRKALFRYFLGHKFFLKDVFGRQMRSPIPALTIIILHSLLLAACVFASFSATLTPLGQEGFFHYFPALIFGGSTPVSLYLGTFILLVLWALISILWLFFGHKNLRSIKQIAIIYAWPLQVSFLSATVAITMFSAGGNAFWITFFTLTSLVIQLLAFILASVDAAGSLKRKSSLYLVLTNGIYIFLLGSLTAWIYAEDRWLEIIDLLAGFK